MGQSVGCTERLCCIYGPFIESNYCCIVGCALVVVVLPTSQVICSIVVNKVFFFSLAEVALN